MRKITRKKTTKKTRKNGGNIGTRKRIEGREKYRG